MNFPTYGNCGSPGVTGPVSWHFAPLTLRSWVTTTASSLVTWVSSSSVVTPSSSAFAKPRGGLLGGHPQAAAVGLEVELGLLGEGVVHLVGDRRTGGEGGRDGRGQRRGGERRRETAGHGCS
jgi:hypothetical protein